MVLGDEPIMKLENSPPEKMKSMLGVKEEVGEIKSPKKSMGETFEGCKRCK